MVGVVTRPFPVYDCQTDRSNFQHRLGPARYERQCVGSSNRCEMIGSCDAGRADMTFDIDRPTHHTKAGVHLRSQCIMAGGRTFGTQPDVPDRGPERVGAARRGKLNGRMKVPEGCHYGYFLGVQTDRLGQGMISQCGGCPRGLMRYPFRVSPRMGPARLFLLYVLLYVYLLTLVWGVFPPRVPPPKPVACCCYPPYDE